MYRRIPALWRAQLGILLLGCSSFATLVPRVSFETLTDASELVVSGTITNAWTAWDSEHKYIWTHYQISATSTLKGNPNPIVEFAEPGGELDGRVMMVGGTVRYAPGEHVVVFLSRMPNRYLRTTGWAQGKFSVDASGNLHGSSSEADLVPHTTPSQGTSLRTLENLSVSELSRRVAAHVRTAAGRIR